MWSSEKRFHFIYSCCCCCHSIPFAPICWRAFVLLHTILFAWVLKWWYEKQWRLAHEKNGFYHVILSNSNRLLANWCSTFVSVFFQFLRNTDFFQPISISVSTGLTKLSIFDETVFIISTGCITFVQSFAIGQINRYIRLFTHESRENGDSKMLKKQV